MTQLNSVKTSLHHNGRALTQAWHKFPLDLQAAAMPQFFRTGPKWEAAVVSDSLGGKGLMVERMRARQSATFLFGAQARAGVWPAEDWKWFHLVRGQETWTSLVFSHRNTNICAYLHHLQPWLLLLCSVGPALLWPNLFWLQCEGAWTTKRRLIKGLQRRSKFTLTQFYSFTRNVYIMLELIFYEKCIQLVYYSTVPIIIQ